MHPCYRDSRMTCRRSFVSLCFCQIRHHGQKRFVARTEICPKNITIKLMNQSLHFISTQIIDELLNMIGIQCFKVPPNECGYNHNRIGMHDWKVFIARDQPIFTVFDCYHVEIRMNCSLWNKLADLRGTLHNGEAALWESFVDPLNLIRPLQTGGNISPHKSGRHLQIPILPGIGGTQVSTSFAGCKLWAKLPPPLEEAQSSVCSMM